MTDTIDASATSGAAVSPPKLTATAVRPSGFEWGAVDTPPPTTPAAAAVDSVAPPLGAIVDFANTWVGTGFNTIFRPQAAPKQDNLLELNLTEETLSFSPSLGSIPNRGMVQQDIFLNGVPYLQTINDVTDPSKKVGIHVEPGVWLAIPPTTTPPFDVTYARLGSIPHGTTIVMQGVATKSQGAPLIPAVDITPTVNGNPFRFPNQTADTPNADRIPQDLSSFIAAGTITQDILNDPNTVLRQAIAGQTITETTTISISTDPASPLFGGGADNIAFLLGDATASHPNANATHVEATFWIETVQNADGSTFTQIQYTQRVDLVFNNVLWPHVSVATLRPLQDPGTQRVQRVASSQTDVGMQYVGISNGKLRHTIQHSDGTWQPEFGLIDFQQNNHPGEFTSVAVAGIGGALHVIGIADGQLWHTIRNADASWQPFFGNIDATAPGDPGTFTAVSACGISSGDLQVTGVSDGNLWFTVRHNAGSWDTFTRVPSKL